MERLLITLGLFALIWVLPIKLGTRQLLKLGFALWLLGGLILCWLGVARFQASLAEMGPLWVGVAAVASALIGIAKGRFVLAKTSQRNIERLLAFTEPQFVRHVYSLRSWIVIGVMIAIAVSLTLFGAPDFVRAIVNLGVGFALLMSSLNYLAVPAEGASARPSGASIGRGIFPAGLVRPPHLHGRRR